MHLVHVFLVNVHLKHVHLVHVYCLHVLRVHVHTVPVHTVPVYCLRVLHVHVHLVHVYCLQVLHVHVHLVHVYCFQASMLGHNTARLGNSIQQNLPSSVQDLWAVHMATHRIANDYEGGKSKEHLILHMQGFVFVEPCYV